MYTIRKDGDPSLVIVSAEELTDSYDEIMKYAETQLSVDRLHITKKKEIVVLHAEDEPVDGHEKPSADERLAKLLPPSTQNA